MSVPPTPSMLLPEARPYLFHHVFLPPKLPQKDDYDAKHELALLESVIRGLDEFKAHTTGQQGGILASAIATISRLRNNHGNQGDVIEEKLEKQLKELDIHGGCLPLHIRSQNAAVIFTESKNEIHVEAFELSPRNESVNTTVGRLQRQFPGPTFALSRDTFKAPGLQHTIAQTLARMSHQSVAGTKPKVKKAGELHDEERDTTNPIMVTELFTAFLRPRCTTVKSSQIHKNTREEVLWLDSNMPWRRSPLWLLIRVVLQLVIQRLRAHDGVTEDLYKHFMIYYMSMVLKECSEKIPPEQSYMMTAKIARRLQKLHLAGAPAWFLAVQDVLESANNAIQRARHHISLQNKLTIDLHRLEGLDFGKDIYCSLPSLDQWLEGIDRRGRSSASVNFQPPSKLLQYHKTELPSRLDLTDPDYKIFDLAAFENWVGSHLGDWLQIHILEEQTCQLLENLASRYHEVAQPLYSTNPEAVSIMLLTVLELWIACDKSAIRLHPMLEDYDPCIPMGMFESLVLPHRSQMARLVRAEAYMKQRQSRIRYHGSGIFKDFGTSSCFSVRYFEQSEEHQSLMADIEDGAGRERVAKHLELELKQRNYRELYALFSEMKCTYIDVVVDHHLGVHESQHSHLCGRCAYKNQAESISIEVHEWPLSSNHLHAKSTVFELNPPQPFAWWRDATIYFLDVLHVNYSVKKQPRAAYQPQSYRGLSSFFTPIEGARRINLLSENKPHLGTHRRDRKIINVTKDDVCLNNGMHFQYYDETARCFVADFEIANELTAIACSYTLPQSISSLQRFLLRPANRSDGLPPNTVIASLHACPEDMTLEEYRALCSMPFGIRIQWKNILRQLAMPSVVFKKVETCIFVLQIIVQVGPAGDSILRIGHAILNDDRFAATLLAEIKKSADRIKENWESAQELCALIFITQRVLSLSSSTKIQDLCLGHLLYFRAVAFQWVAIVREKANNTIEQKHRTDLMAQSVHIALICVCTFDTEGPHLARMFERTSEATIFFQCCMMIHDRKGIIDVTSNCLLPILFYRWETLSYRYYRLIADNTIPVHGQTVALDKAIVQTWAAYRMGSPWSVASEESDYWLATRMVCESSPDGGLRVHYNLVTGQLLINGQPLASLPSDYKCHNTYKLLFGRFLIEVMPSDLPGMQFSGQRAHMGHTIHLGKQSIPGSNDSDLCVRAVKKKVKKNEVWEFIPPRLLAGAFPDAFVENYAHWYNLDRGYLEFRPAKRAWRPSDSHWKLHKRCPERGWCLEKDGIILVSSRSETAGLISTILDPIERASKLHCKLDVTSSVLEIEIPRLRIAFSLQSGSSSVRSRQYPNMVIDADQSLETLVGLRNKLILLDVDSRARMILVPEGDVTWEKESDHVAVKIGWQAVANHHAYSVDSQLGRLVDNGSLQSKLLLCYLHAVTSFCIPDPLTRKTGTEQSLSILRSASMRSFVRLQTENTAILARLAELTPERRYYPANERVMQSVEWQENLSCLTQHDDFREQVVEIFNQDRRMGIFHPETQVELPSLSNTDTGLLQRSRIRSSTFRVSSYGAEDHTTKHDRLYSSRGRNYQSEECIRVFTLCKILHDEIAPTAAMTVETVVSYLWELLSQPDSVHGPEVQISKARIEYDASYILEPSSLISAFWCSIHRLLCSETSRPNKYQVMIWLSTLAFSKNFNMAPLKVLAAIYINPQMRFHMPPRRPQFQPRQGYEMKETELRTSIQDAILYQTPESRLPRRQGENHQVFQWRKKAMAEENRKRALDNFLSDLHLQWPTSSPSIPIWENSPRFHDYFDTQKAMDKMNDIFSTWFYNRELRQYIVEIASIAFDQSDQSVTIPSCRFHDTVCPSHPSRGSVSVDDILSELLGPPPALEMKPPRLDGLLRTSSDPVPKVPRLASILRELESQKRSDYEAHYVEQLRGSITSLRDSQKHEEIVLDDSDLKDVISNYLESCAKHSAEIYQTIISRMSISGGAANTLDAQERMSYEIMQTLARGHTWPRLSPDLLLQQLTRNRWPRVPEGWKRCFIAYGCSITALQRAKRLLSLVDQREDLIQELQNPGHSNWDPYDFPESLLLEIENGILIRDVQEQIARKMRDLRPGQNAVMQLNMGEGKSSVIVPIVVAARADGSCLVRVLVAKPQSRQMFQMLVSKLGGLLGRRIYHLPVSRSLRIGVTEANEIERMCRECMEKGGILLIQPEHILSLKLMCLECSIAGQNEVGRSILKTLEFFRESSRDVVDESDENFSVKFELIYTMGTQQPLEFSPLRWIIIQQILDLVRRYADDIKEEYLRAIEVDGHQPGRFPRIRLLHETAGRELLKRIAQHVCEDGIDSIAISRQTETSRRAILAYILNPNLSAQEIDVVENKGPASFWTESTKDSLLLLRGLLAGGVLAFCFGQKRWRVNYGPDHIRRPPTKLSVPYRAKDNPAPRSEFSHPDVVIILTCLNYYYGGLSDDELFLTFHHLVRSDQGESEYQTWVNDDLKIPNVYHQLGGINLRDRHHCSRVVFPNFRFSKGAIDYFLSQIVFPKEIKEFPSKLSASGWDIGEIKEHPTVGFSGTNDSRVTLPLSVEQLDLPEQNHTNALVLEYLLRPENSVTFSHTSADKSRSDAQVLLDMVVNLDPPTQVILDVGAQILELTNLEVAQTWLRMTPDDSQMQAIVFVNEHDVICVVDRAGIIEPLQTSPFAQQLGACYIFLDEAHTRGIDLRLPPTYRAAVTLGASITKDKLVQACMRMRKLGKGQSVVFYIPEEISTKISSLSGKSTGYIGVSDVLCWAISETWVETQRSIPLWRVQGKRYERQSELWRSLRGQVEISQSQAKGFLEDESQTLEQRYRPCLESIFSLETESPQTENVQRIQERCRQFDNLSFSLTQLQEEQERELAPEVEQERQVQRPSPAQPKEHHLHEHVLSFVSTGVLAASSAAFRPAFEVLRNTSAAKYLNVSEFPPGLLVTSDFAETVRRPSCLDDYQRPVEWVLTSHDHGSSNMKHMIIISPYEANKLHCEVRQSRAVMMHVYAPRQNRSLRSLDDLSLYPVPMSLTAFSIPTTLKIQLNLFAGQLYISSYNEYRQLCDFLGVLSVKTPDGFVVAADGFIVARNEPSTTTFTRSPLNCLKTLMSQIRKDGQEIGKTHLGKILDGKLLYPCDFQDCSETPSTMTLSLRTL